MTFRQIAGVIGSRLVGEGLVEPGRGLEAAALILKHLQLYVKEGELVAGMPQGAEAKEDPDGSV